MTLVCHSLRSSFSISKSVFWAGKLARWLRALTAQERGPAWRWQHPQSWLWPCMPITSAPMGDEDRKSDAAFCLPVQPKPASSMFSKTLPHSHQQRVMGEDTGHLPLASPFMYSPVHPPMYVRVCMCLCVHILHTYTTVIHSETRN